jgi:hypothetical protein
MKTLTRALVLVGILSALTATAALANGGPPETTEGFVCPVLGGEAGEHGNATGITGPIGPEGDEFFTVIGPDVNVPTHATNGNGAGTPGGDHSSPGDTDYTAIWATP